MTSPVSPTGIRASRTRRFRLFLPSKNDGDVNQRRPCHAQLWRARLLWIDEWTTEKGKPRDPAGRRNGIRFPGNPAAQAARFRCREPQEGPARGRDRCDCLARAARGAHMPEHPETAKRFLLDALDQLEAVEGDYPCGCPRLPAGPLDRKAAHGSGTRRRRGHAARGGGRGEAARHAPGTSKSATATRPTCTTRWPMAGPPFRRSARTTSSCTRIRTT